MNCEEQEYLFNNLNIGNSPDRIVVVLQYFLHNDVFRDRAYLQLFWMKLLFGAPVPESVLEQAKQDSQDTLVQQFHSVYFDDKEITTKPTVEKIDEGEWFQLLLFQAKHKITHQYYDEAKKYYTLLSDYVEEYPEFSERLYVCWTKDCLSAARDSGCKVAARLKWIQQVYKNVKIMRQRYCHHHHYHHYYRHHNNNRVLDFSKIMETRAKIYHSRLMSFQEGEKLLKEHIEKYHVIENDNDGGDDDDDDSIYLKCSWGDLLTEYCLLGNEFEEKRLKYWDRARQYYDSCGTHEFYPISIHKGIALCSISHLARDPNMLRQGIKLLKTSDWQQCYYYFEKTDLWIEFQAHAINFLSNYYCEKGKRPTKLSHVIRENIAQFLHIG